jgi:DNA-binding response OmpR family regulator
MTDIVFRVLVVDDDKLVRELVVRSLSERGITCDECSDASFADKLLAAKKYEMVVTDLRMPQRNGHALAVDLLARDPRPLVVVLTGVLEPRLAEDLIFRGVDAMELKPVQFKMFAAKLHALLKRRHKEGLGEAETASSPSPAATI